MKYYGPQISNHLKDFLLKRYSDVIVFGYAKDDSGLECVNVFISMAQKIVVGCQMFKDEIAFYENTFENLNDVETLFDQSPIYKTNINNIENMFYVC